MTSSSATAIDAPFRVRLDRFAAIILWILIALGFLFCLSPFRLLPDVFLLICLTLWFRRHHLRRAWFAGSVLALFLLMEFALPFDVSVLYWPGRPRIVPLVMGLPRQATFQRAQRHEAVLGGCIVMGNEPRWILVW